jgi:hypothetical protein
MRSRLSFVSLFLLVLIVSFDAFAGGSLWTTPKGFYLAPEVYNKTLYGPSTSGSTWHITQWGSPSTNMPPFHGSTSLGTSESVTVSRTQYNIKQATQNPPLACGAEFDAFAEVNVPSTYPGYPSAGPSASPNLLTMNTLTLHIVLTQNKITVLDHACQITQTSQMVALVLHNTVNGQTFFYQLELGGYYNRNGLPKQFWWSTAAPTFGYTENVVPAYHVAQASPGSMSKYSVNFLPNILNIITEGPDSMDRDTSHWVISSTYHGNAVWGHMNVSTTWSGFSLVWK